MLRFIEKNEYWRAEDEGFLARVDYDPVYWHIKQVQDAVLLRILGDVSGKNIVEAGGGKSRVLGWLAKRNTCINVDELKGKDGGPVRGVDDKKIRHIYGRVGQTQSEIADLSQDIVFSISVVEHIPAADLESFFGDIARMLRPGGQMIHMIDCYLRAPDEDNGDEARRYDEYIKAFDRIRFRPYSPPDILRREAIGFHPRFASNPDRIMNMWNKDNPGMRKLRAEAQGCSWVMRAIRI